MDLENLRLKFNDCLQKRSKVHEEIRQLEAGIRGWENELKKRERISLEKEEKAIRRELDSLKRRLSIYQNQFKEAEKALSHLREQLIAAETSEDIIFPWLSDRYPFLLLPLRLETRFRTVEGKPQLWVRIYPDQISIDSHEPELSAEEVQAGRLCLERSRMNGGNADNSGNNAKLIIEKKAWRDLARQVGPSRAAWILKTVCKYEGRDLRELNPHNYPDAPRALLLPDCFWVKLYQGNDCVKTVRGKLIPDNLPVLWSPESEAPTDELFDEKSRWVWDFEAAEQVGMAVRIPLEDFTPEQIKSGFSRVIVVGIKPSIHPAKGAAPVEELIDAHHYTDGLAFLAQGTPTNNTQTAKSGYSSSMRDLDGAYEVECSPLKQVTKKWTNAGRLARALGIDANGFGDWSSDEITEDAIEKSIFAHIALAEEDESPCGQEMRQVLWWATWQPYLELLLGVQGKYLVPVREHFVHFISGRGPLPVLRVGNLPYGVLPVAKIRKWVPESGEDALMSGVLKKLFNRFLTLANDPELVPRIGATQDPDRELLRLLAMEPTSCKYALRTVVSDSFIRNLIWFLAPSLFGEGTIFDFAGLGSYHWVRKWLEIWMERLQANADLLREVNGLAVNDDPESPSPPILRAFHWGMPVEVDPPLIVKPPDGVALLFLTTNNTYENWQVSGLFAELVKLTLGLVRGTANEPVIGDALLRLRDKCPASVREELLRETLDLATHRLDAWITSLATKRLAAMRRQQGTGIHLGACGWVEDLKPRNLLGLAPVGSGGDLQGGYVHAPSIPQAAAAAVLRSAYVSHAAEGLPEASKVNLSSERVRMALNLIDGVRQKQTLGALLGYQFEKGLDERGRDQYIETFRAKFPLKAGKETPSQPGEPTEAVAARNVVDGVALATAWNRVRHSPRSLQELAADLPDDDELLAELDRLLAALDAVSDLWFAEAIFQGTQGRYERMGAALDAAAGAGPIPEVEVVQTKRRGRSDTHRVTVMFNARVNREEGNVVVNSRETAEPVLDDWAGMVLQWGQELSCTCWVPSKGNKELRITAQHLADELELSPLDFVYLSTTPPSGEETALEQVVRYVARKKEGLDATVEVKVDLGRAAPSGARSMAEAVEIAQSLLKVISNATPLHPSNLCLPEEAGVAGESGNNQAEKPTGAYTEQDYQELKQRVCAALTSIVLLEEEPGFVDENASEDAICAALKKAFKFGITSAVPASPKNDGLLQKRRNAVRQELASRSQTAESLAAQAETSSKSDFDHAIKLLIEAMQALFGRSFTVLPAFPAPRAAELKNAYQASILGSQGSERVWLWLQQCAQTHPALHRFETALMMAQAWQDEPVTETTDCNQEAARLLAADLPRLKVLQLPYREPDRWTALATEEWDPLTEAEKETIAARPQGCLSLVVHLPLKEYLDLDEDERVAGIVIDQWEERIPDNQEITGLSFCYDQPGAQAPQALLLAVPGEWSEEEPKSWSIADLFETVYDTMDLLKVRAVDLDALKGLGQFLPALYTHISPETLEQEEPA